MDKPYYLEFNHREEFETPEWTLYTRSRYSTYEAAFKAACRIESRNQGYSTARIMRDGQEVRS